MLGLRGPSAANGSQKAAVDLRLCIRHKPGQLLAEVAASGACRRGSGGRAGFGSLL